jgi:hypothetical protein
MEVSKAATYTEGIYRAMVGDSNSMPKVGTTAGGSRHLSIGPSRAMRLDEYVQAIFGTQSKWVLVK